VTKTGAGLLQTNTDHVYTGSLTIAGGTYTQVGGNSQVGFNAFSRLTVNNTGVYRLDGGTLTVDEERIGDVGGSGCSCRPAARTRSP
jgi:hypothetical protein